MRTTHQYLEKYPISTESEKLIVGTIHPHDYNNFTIPFFYGNVTSLWNILSEAFPDKLKKPLSLEGIINFLSIKKISVSDTIKKCDRQNPTSLDKDLIPIDLNERIINDIKKSKIKEILFTSGFGKNNAFRLFYTDILGLKITQEIKKNREIVVDEKMATNVPGIFAAGDGTGGWYQVAKAVYQGAVAGSEAAKFLRESK